MRALEDYGWPGNVRELRNVVERAVYRWDDWDRPVGYIQFDPFDSPWKPASAPRAEYVPEREVMAAAAAGPAPALDSIADLRQAVDAYEKTIVEQALARNRYNQRQTAKALALSYDQLRHCMKKHALNETPGG